MKLFKVELGGFQPWMWAIEGDLYDLHKKWTQQPEHHSLFFFEHDGIISINNKPIPFSVGNVAYVAPGTKVGFDRIGSDTYVYQLTFGLVGRTETVGIPAVADLGDLTEVRRGEFLDSLKWLHISTMRGLACAFNTLWSIAQPWQNLRKSDAAYHAESLIVKRLGEPINIPDLAAEVGISHSHLLRLFRDEHSCTIQEFIRDQRSEYARKLISETDLPLKEIAIRTGMSDLQYFNKLVRSTTGLSPRALRDQAITRARH